MRNLQHLTSILPAILVAAFIMVEATAIAAPAGQTVLETPKPRFHKPKGDENLQLPKLVKVTRLSPIFALPSTKSKVMADVDVDTALIAREISKKGEWLKVEDEEGNAGWMPRSRTNFNMLFAPDADPIPDPDPKEVNDARKNWEAEQKPPSAPHGYMHFPAVTLGTLGGGLSYTFLQRITPATNSPRTAYFGAQIGTYRYWDYNKDIRTYAPYLKFRWLGKEANADFASGPDLGVLLRLPKKNWVGLLGYCWGWMPKIGESGFSLLLRPGVEIGGPSRFGIELESGWFF